MSDYLSKFLYGSHEAMPPDVMPNGWILFLAEVGHSSEPHPGVNFTTWTSQDYGVICRIQHSFHAGGGCLPLPQDLDGFLRRVESLTRNSQGCENYIIGNEPNLPVEWPSGIALTPEYVADIYTACQNITGGEDIILPPVAPWNDQIGYGWVEYFARLIDACDSVDAFALHTYSRGPDPRSVTSEDKMDPPYQMLYNGFRTYRDWLAAIPERYRDRPAYITETNQNDAWLNEPNSWVQAAYAEIDAWNRVSSNQTIRALILYRWPRYDKYYIEGKQHVIDDFRFAQTHGYKWTEEPDSPDPGGDLMKNPSFELPYDEPPNYGTVKVAHDWTAFWSTGEPPQEASQGPCQMPEYKPLPRDLDPRRVVDGDTAQCWFIRYKVMDAGIYQTVSVTEGKRYKFDVSLQAWCTQSNDPTVSDGEMYCSLGIDTRGRTNPWELGVLWTPWEWINAEHRRFESLEVQAQASEITLFIRCWNKWRLSHNDAYADDVHLYVIGEPDPPDPPDPGTCTGATPDQVRQIVREELRAVVITLTGGMS